MQKFYEIRDGGCTILFVSHDRYQVNTICQRALYLEKGTQVLFGPARRVVDRYVIDTEEAMARSQATVKAAAQARAQIRRTEIPAESKPASPIESASGLGKLQESEPQSVDSSSLATSHQVHEPEAFFRINSVTLLDDSGKPVEVVKCGADLRLVIAFEALSDEPPELISFVFNLYRHDDTYMCGTTTLMDDIGPHLSGKRGQVSIDFPNFPLLAGRYKWRVAINDDRGFVVHAEAKEAAVFEVVDDFKAIGMINLPRRWTFEIDGLPARQPKRL
jgi:lipopolysaccharide transport system ATP-binding protein